MYATIRRYTAKAGTINKRDLDDFKHRINEGFLPLVQEIRGFHSYYVVGIADKGLVTISLFDDKDGATESTRRAADFVKKDPMKDQLGSPEVIEGELLVVKEAMVGAR